MPKSEPLSQQDFIKFVEPKELKLPETDCQVSKVVPKCSCPGSGHTEFLNDFSDEITGENGYGFSQTPAFQGMCEKHGFYNTAEDNKSTDLIEHKILNLSDEDDDSDESLEDEIDDRPDLNERLASDQVFHCTCCGTEAGSVRSESSFLKDDFCKVCEIRQPI